MEKRLIVVIITLGMFSISSFILGVIAVNYYPLISTKIEIMVVPIAIMFTYYVYNTMDVEKNSELLTLDSLTVKIIKSYIDGESFDKIQKKYDVNLNQVRRAIQKGLKLAK